MDASNHKRQLKKQVRKMPNEFKERINYLGENLNKKIVIIKKNTEERKT